MTGSSIRICAGLIALFLLAGRWGLGRLLGGESDSMVLEPRLWAVVLLCSVAFAPHHLPTRPLQRRTQTAILAVLVFLAYHIVSVAWAPDIDMATTKGLELTMIALVVIAVVRLSALVDARELSRNIWRALVGVFAVFALLALLGNQGGSRISVLGGGPNVFGRNMALLGIACVYRLFAGRERALPIVGVSIAGMLVLLSGSRGALLALGTGVAALFWLHRVRPSRLLLLVLGATFVAALAALYTDTGQAALEMFRERVVRLTLEEEYDSGRSTLSDGAVALGWTAPLYGDGLAGFAARTGGMYPHNIALEAFAEGGLVGLVTLVVCVVPPLLLLARRRSQDCALDLAAYAALFASAQFSGDFFDSRGLLLFGALAVLQLGGGDQRTLIDRRSTL